MAGSISGCGNPLGPRYDTGIPDAPDADVSEASEASDASDTDADSREDTMQDVVVVSNPKGSWYDGGLDEGSD
jgi:hypothetical protein